MKLRLELKAAVVLSVGLFLAACSLIPSRGADLPAREDAAAATAAVAADGSPAVTVIVVTATTEPTTDAPTVTGEAMAGMTTAEPGASPPFVEPTASSTAIVDTATAVPTTPPTVPPPTAVPPSPIPVFMTPIEYVMAQTDVNIRGGPGQQYGVIGWVAEGQLAKVTGISSDKDWWRVICPNGLSGSCWVSARPQHTLPAAAPGSSPTNTPLPPPTLVPTPTPVPATCTNRADLVADVTVPDGTVFAPNTGFNKTWRILNSGTCTWDGRYKMVHAGGTLLGAIAGAFPLPAPVAAGQSIDLTVSLVSPAEPGNYLGEWMLQDPQGQTFGVGRSSSPFWVEIAVSGGGTATISGVVYEDTNQNGVYNSGEPLVSGREVWLIPGTACHVRQDAVAIAISEGGRYAFSGDYSGSYCVGLSGAGGLEDVAGVTVAPGQTLDGINLSAPLSGGSISGFLWNDYCLTAENGDALDGNCAVDANGDYHADGMIQPTEGTIAGVSIDLQGGSCAAGGGVQATAVTDSSGRYLFANLAPGTYCVSMNAATPDNAPKLLPGDWTFPSRGIWYQEVTLLGNDQAYPVNFGWDYQLQ